MKTDRLNVLGIESLQVAGVESDVGIIFLHGYGANMHDLFPLWELWHADKFNWYFPNGIHSLNMGQYEGRAWFSIDMEKLERSIREGTQRDMKGTIPPEFDSTLAQLELFIQEVSKKHKSIVLGGFSQGAMCASHLAMNPRLKIDGLILLSGGLLAQDRCPASARGIPFYQSHGTGDPILSIEGAKDLEEKLHSLNFTGKLQTFSGGHEIPPVVIQGVKTFISQFA